MESGRSHEAVKILMVERDQNLREFAEHFLDEVGYAVEFMLDGREAAERALTLLPDVLITGILLPTLDGLTLCRELKANPVTRGIRVLVFSILAAGKRAEEAGADAFLMKPLDPHTFVATVKWLLASRPEGAVPSGAVTDRAVPEMERP